MPIATTMSLRTALSRWHYGKLFDHLTPIEGELSSLSLTFSASDQKKKITVIGETCLDEIEAVLLLCRKQLKGK